MLSLAARHPLMGRAAGRPSEDDHRGHASVVQLGRSLGNPKIVTTESNGHGARVRLVAHLLEIPESLSVRPYMSRDHLLSSSASVIAESGTLKSYDHANRVPACTPMANSTTVPSTVRVVRCSSTTHSPGASWSS